MAEQEHIHKYKAVVLGGQKVKRVNGRKQFVNGDGYPVYKCMIPRCSHYVARNMVVGRSTICWRCGGELIMTARNLRQVKPIHRECAVARSVA